MTNYLQKLPIVLLLAFTLPLWSQVSFTNNGNLLNSVSGNSQEDCAVDMNGDNLDDVVRVTTGHLYIDYQQADGSFIQQDFAMNFSVYPTWSMCAGDLNDDGYNDLLFGSGNAVSFVYSSDNGAAYSEVAHPEYIFSQRSTICDIDNDGDLDAFVCHDVDQSHPYRNDGTGAMTLDQSLIPTADLAGNYAALWVDYDNDGDSDLYITKCRQGSTSGDIERTNLLYQNNADGTFTEVGEAANMNDNAQSWTTVFEDFDNDGDFDAFIVNHDFKNRFLLNNGDGTFTDIIETTGINPNDLGAWENAAGDFNNDGFVDIFSEMSQSLYLNNGDLTFTGYTTPIRSGGIGDLNNDGFLDVIRGNGLWLNDANDNNWVKICTQGILSNKNGIGSRVEIYGAWGMQIREVRSSQSFSTMSSLETYFGIGEATAIDSIIVKWPSGFVTRVDNPAINTTHIVPEAECIVDASTIEASGSTLICEGTTVELSGPDGFASYLWSNGETTQTISASSAGVYNLISTNDDNCVSLSNNIGVSYQEDTAPTITVNGDDRFCTGQSVELTSSSDNNPTWSNEMTGESITVTESGTYTVATDAVCSEDQLNSEAVEITVLPAAAPELESLDFSNSVDDLATITVTGDSLLWYDVPTGGDVIASGNIFVTPPVVEETSYYVESVNIYGGNILPGGKLDMAGSGGLPGTGAYSYFDVWESFTLLTVEVQVPDNAPEGERHFQLVDENEVVLEEITVDLAHGNHTIELNWAIPEGTGLSLRCPENNLFRNNGGVNYPYPIGNHGEITTSFYGNQYYYYFYNWHVEAEKTVCISDRTAIDLVLVGLNELPGISELKMYPNPANEKVFLTLDSESSHLLNVRLFNALGKEVKSFSQFQINAGENTYQLNVANLPSGVYTAQFVIEEKVATGKIILE